jgi:HK97 family phage prohead protease
MPYFISKTSKGWDTVKDDGTVLGKHKTKKQAIDQMVAVSLTEKIPAGGELKRAVDAGTYSPPEGVSIAAKRALKWIEEGYAGSGFTSVGRRRASQLASGGSISAETVNRMISYFARHQIDKKALGFSSGEDGFPSAGRVAWDAWGGDMGQSWVNGLSNKASTRAISSVGISDFDDTLYVNGNLNQEVYSWIQTQDIPLLVVTGRHESDRKATKDLLDKLGVDYSRLIMQPDNQNNSAGYKGDTAKKLLADGLDVVFVIENNAEARAAYKSAGVESVYSPNNLPAEDGVRQLEDMQMEDVPVTKDVLLAELEDLKGDVLELVGKLVETVSNLSDLVEVSDQVVPSGDAMPLDPSMVQEDSVRFVEPEKIAELAKRGERVTKGIERRQVIRDLEIRAEGDGMTLRGYAAVFNSPSQPLPFTETIEPGAFRNSLEYGNDIKLLWNHDTGTVLGSTRAGTLKVTEDAHGLLIEAQLPDTQAGRDAATLIKRGDVNAFSFGFRVPANGDKWVSADQRILKRVNIHEVSVVSWPAYTATEGTASVRSMTDLEEKILKLAELRGVSAEELTSALLALESGEELTERQGELLTETLNKVLQQDPEVTNPQAILDLKKKKLDLLMQRV